jgi:hypothetical protein
MFRPKLISSFVEYYLKNPDKLEELEDDKKRFYWAQRIWHPILWLNWMSGIDSDGKGLITYPDGSRLSYKVIDRHE